MAVVHQNFVDLADRLIKKNGRQVFIRRQIGEVDKEAGKPWLGKVPETQDTKTFAAFLDNDTRDLLLMLPGEADQRTTLEREIDRVVFIPAKGLPFDIEIEHQIVDGDKVWEILKRKLFQPGPTKIVWKVWLSN